MSAVVREAGTIAIKRWLANHPQEPSQSGLTLTLPDLEASLPSIRPSAMRSVFVETPPIRYSEIGGQASVIQKLREAVEWPLLHPETFLRLGVRPPKGVLLYGPPGCSKTVLARACAFESGINFIAVKGPEVRCMYIMAGRNLSRHTGVKQVRRRVRTYYSRDFQKSPGRIAVHCVFCTSRFCSRSH